MFDTPFPGAGLPPNLMPNPPPYIPDAPDVGDATAGLSAFVEPQDADAIIARLQLDRPLKLYIPNRERYPQEEFRIINSLAPEIGDAKNKGFEQVTNPELARLFDNLVAGTDKEGKAYRPLLFGRPKKVGEHIRRRNAKLLGSIYAGMDPANKEFNGRYTSSVDKKSGTFGQFTGAGFRIRG